MFHERELFGSAFADAGFDAAWATRKNDQGAERLARADVAEPAKRVDEAQSIHADVLSLAGTQQHQSHEVVGQRDHQQFFVDAGHAFAPQHVQVQRLLEV